MADRDQLIRERAHQIWEKEGRPAGREAEHWKQAERDVSEKEKAMAGATTTGGRRSGAKTGGAKAGSTSRVGAAKAGTAKAGGGTRKKG